MEIDIVTKAEFWKKVEDNIGDIPFYIKCLFEVENLAQPFLLKKLFEKQSIEGIKMHLEYIMKSSTFSRLIKDDDNMKNYCDNHSQIPMELSVNDIVVIENIKNTLEQKPNNFWEKHAQEVTDPASKRLKYMPKEFNFFKMLSISNFLNKDRYSEGYRYTDMDGFVMVCVYVYLLGGRILYRFLNRNLPIPAETTIQRTIGKTCDKVVEGALRVDALKTHLIEHKTALEVWISEDGSGAVNKVQYDSKNNTLVGLKLPTDENSMPIKMFFKATSAKAIQEHFTNTVSSLLYIYMAQANDPNVPPFCLLFFGTDNSMLFTDVENRFKFVTNELQKDT